MPSYQRISRSCRDRGPFYVTEQGRSHTGKIRQINGLVQERRNSSALAMELCLSCTKPSKCKVSFHWLKLCLAIGRERAWMLKSSADLKFNRRLDGRAVEASIQFQNEKISEWENYKPGSRSGFEAWQNCHSNVYRFVNRGPGERFKNAYELLNLRALKISMFYENHIFLWMGKIFCVEFKRVPLKFHTTYLTHTLKDVDIIRMWKFKSC